VIYFSKDIWYTMDLLKDSLDIDKEEKCGCKIIE
jgi:hypothetical protein